ncbi:DUF6961 family protein [Sphingomonas colocasiae]|uniref:DUF6961 family protein n=1 Tax=Sphingomonas colocasiae TaxID=1848973 RepID=UPI003CCEA8EE
MTPEQEALAIALQVERLHGERASAFVAEQLRSCVFVGDKTGGDLWKLVAEALESRPPPPQ